MGTLVHKNGAVATICGHVNAALTNAAAWGGQMAEITAAELGPAHASIVKVDAELALATQAAVSAKAALTVMRSKATGVVARVHDSMWNDIGRPRTDEAFSQIFPSGYSSYIQGTVEQQPGRMELLARLLEEKLHPKLSAAEHTAAADKVRTAAQELAAQIKASRPPVKTVALISRSKTVVARASQEALVRLKRSLKNAGFSETQIHQVIPEYRPKKRTKAGLPSSAVAATASDVGLSSEARSTQS